MTGSEYLEGAFFFAVMLGATGVAAHLALRWCPGLRGVPRVLGFATLWLAGIVAAHVLPGALEILGRVEVAVTSALLLAAVVAATLIKPAAETEDAGVTLYPPAPESGIRSSLFAAGACGAVTILLLSLFLRDVQTAAWHVDVISFHLSNVARWIQSGSLWHINDFIPDRSPGNYPETGDVFSLTVILPWRADFLIRFVNIPLLGLTGLASYALARELRAPAATAAIVAAGLVALPVVSWVAFASLADTAMLATFGPGAYFLVRNVRSGRRADLVLAGIGLGLSLGTRWYAVYAVAAVVGVWAVAWLVAKRPFRQVAGGFGLLTGLVLLFGGFWLLRNLVESSNPFYPVKVAPLGVTIFDAPPDLYRELLGFSIADYATDFHVWKEYLWPGFLDAMGWISVVFWAGLAGGAVLAFARLRRRADTGPHNALILALVAAAAVIAVAFVFTPYTAVGPPGKPQYGYVNSRYVMPALVLGTGVLAWLLGRTGPWRQLFELGILVAILDACRRLLDLPGPGVTGRGLVLAIAAVGLALAFVVAVRTFNRPGLPRLGLAAGAAVGVLAALAVGRHQQERYEENRYVNVNPVLQYVHDQEPSGARIGIVGEGWSNYPLFGPGLGNDVEYIGQRRRGTMRPWRTKREFNRAVSRGRYDLVSVQESNALDENQPLHEERWLKERGYKLVASADLYSFPTPQRLYVAPQRSL